MLVPGSQVPYHYHTKRESVIVAISGEAIEVVEGEEIPFNTGDIIYLSPGEKHMTINRSDNDFRYLEFFTCPPVTADFDPDWFLKNITLETAKFRKAPWRVDHVYQV